jgi:hypothetical protein
MNIPDHISESLETFCSVKITEFFDPDPGTGIFLAPDLGWKNSDLKSGISIPDPKP